MSRPHKITRLLWNVFPAVLFAGGLSCPYILAACGLPMTACVFPLSLIVALFMALCALLPGKTKFIPYAALFILEGGLFLFSKGAVFHMVQAFKALILQLQGVTGALAFHAKGLCLLLTLVLTVFAYLLARHDAMTVPILGVCVLLAGMGLILTGGDGFIYLVPAAAGMILMLCTGDKKAWIALPIALLIALCAFALTPRAGTVQEDLQETAEDVRAATEDYFFFTTEREAFSLYKAGFQPLKDRLGGKANPGQDAVMAVTAGENEHVYLRATAYNEYTGLNWYDTLSGRRYLYAAPSYTELKQEIFDLTRPLVSGTVQEEKLHVRMLSPAATTVFAPQRMRVMDMLQKRMVPYFNDAGEIYLTRNMNPGDEYAMTYLPLDAHDAQVQAWIRECAAADDPHYDDACQKYSTVPAHIQSEVWDIANKVTEGLTDPLEKALAIRNYLKTNYTYTLDVEDPPSSVDFVAYFLLGSQEGYCTYFASAQTILCRMAGVPARYVTGYLARTDESGNCVVYQKDAHAWCEVYLNGFGWLTLDATADAPTDDKENEDNPEWDSPPTPTPSPSPTPTPTPTPTPEPDNEEPPVTTPTPEPEEMPTPTPEPPEDPPEDEGDKPPFPWVILLIVLLIAAVIARYMLSQPERRAQKHPNKAGDIYLNACMHLLAAMGFKRAKNETLLEFAARAQQKAPVKPLFDMAAAALYGKHYAIDAQRARNIYRMLLMKATRMQKMRMRITCMFTKA